LSFPRRRESSFFVLVPCFRRDDIAGFRFRRRESSFFVLVPCFRRDDIAGFRFPQQVLIIKHPLNLEDMTPLEFLIHLESDHNKGDCYYIRFVTGGWVKEEHLPHLFDLLDSDEKCTLPVFFASSPHVDMGDGSTVGREAGFLIKNYMGQRYPAPLASRLSDADKKELRKWWKEYRKKGG